MGKNAPLMLLAGVLAIAGYMAWLNYFIQDDAYISFRYARNFADGNGLVWYPGLREYGYTNFLFTLGAGILMWLGSAPESAAALISVPAYLGSILLTVLLARSITHNRIVPYICALALVSDHSVTSYASGGMETSLQMVLVLLTYCLAVWRSSAWAIGLSSALALLCRLDSALLLYAAHVYVAAHYYYSKKWQPLWVSVLIPVAAVAALLIGCDYYYATALPNTFYAKLNFGEYTREGFAYMASYLAAEWVVPLGVCAAAMAAWCMQKHTAARLDYLPYYLLAACAIWIFYIIGIGGDFMEFRLLVPMLPLFYVGCFCVIAEAAPAKTVWLLLAALMLGGHAHHRLAFQSTNLMDNTQRLNGLLKAPDMNWIEVGKSLHTLFYTGSPEDVSIAVHAAGAIPYYSGLPALDMFGLNDRWVALNGEPAKKMAGHRRKAPYDYIVERQINIIIDYPRYYCTGWHTGMLREYPWLPLLLLPLPNDCYVLGHYLTPHPKIDALIKAGIIQRISPP